MHVKYNCIDSCYTLIHAHANNLLSYYIIFVLACFIILPAYTVYVGENEILFIEAVLFIINLVFLFSILF
jgi:hypothetical protein